MKQIFKAWLCGTVISAATLTTFAQVAEQGISYAAIKSPLLSLEKDAVTVDSIGIANPEETAKARLKKAKVTYKALKASARAQQFLSKQFDNITDAKWIAETNVLTAYFKKSDVETRVRFDKSGAWLHTLLYYHADKMPAEVKALVTKSYPEYNITGVSEIKENNQVFYVVHMESEKSWRKVIVRDGEAETLQRISKTE